MQGLFRDCTGAGTTGVEEVICTNVNKVCMLTLDCNGLVRSCQLHELFTSFFQQIPTVVGTQPQRVKELINSRTIFFFFCYSTFTLIPYDVVRFC